MSNHKNLDFVQLDRTGINRMRDMIVNNPTAANIFMFLTQKMDRVNAISCSQKLLQEVTGKSKMTVYRAIKFLESENFVTILRQGNCIVYVMNPDIVWSSWKTDRKYCEFSGKILVSKEENEQIDKKLKSFKTLKENASA